jgi:cold shock protein
VAVEARGLEWHDDDGWGVVESPETPGGWVHFSHVDLQGYRFTAVRVRVPGQSPQR